ncbi:Clavaminate synthase-like protein [Agrocybe pediades]|nr:Clavaminate synthase-like protein [Agrocybe pediades]
MTWDLEAVSLIIQLRNAPHDGHSSSPDHTDPELHLILQAASDITQGVNQDKCLTELQGLTITAYEKMRRATGLGPLTYWREIYSDLCILRAIVEYRQCCLMQAVSTLDHALIIAGASSRLDLVLVIISRIQSKMQPSPHIDSPALDEPSLQVTNIPPSKHLESTIPCISPPSFIAFQSTFSRRPFILRGFARDWPALNNHPWRQAAYLRSIAGPGRVVPVEVGTDYRTDDWNQTIMPWDAFLSTLDFHDQPAQRNGEMLYLAQHDLTIQFPSLRDDIIIPDYVYASLSNSDNPNYRPPANDDHVLFNTWLGPKGTISPAHTDPYFNCYVQVMGQKLVWLAPPSVSESMYPIRSEDTSDGPREGRENSSMSNTSRVDVFSEDLEGEKFPAYINNVMPVAMKATLVPGDMLFFPPGWWHAMKSETSSFSFSFWF